MAVYERRAGEWLERRNQAGDGLGRRFRERVGTGPIVDLGCGPGRYLSELGAPVVGLDATAAMLVLARARDRPLLRADLEALPLADHSVAGLFARHSYLHVPKHRLPGALGEARRVLRPGGWLFATLIEGAYEGHRLVGDDFPGRFFALYDVDAVSSALTGAGFVEVAVERVGRGANRDLHVTARR